MDQDNIYCSKSEMSFDTKQAPFLSNRASEHNVYMTYVCLVNDGRLNNSGLGKSQQPTDVEEVDDDDGPDLIQVERSKAVHELVESIKKTDHSIIKEKPPNTFTEESEVSDQDDEYNKYDNPKILKLTKMKWLSEDQHGYPDSSSPSVSSARSTTSSKAEDTDDDGENRPNIGEKYLSTILRLDKEHNLFGLSSIAVVGSKQSRPTKQNRKDDERPVFHQTAIVQVCRSSCGGAPCSQPCCRYKSNTDLPASLRYSGCGTCGSVIGCVPCYPPPPPPPRSSCISTCMPCPPVQPPTCAFIPRVPKIHAACLPDTPQLALTCFSRKPCKIESPSTCPSPEPPCYKSPECTCGLTAFVPPEPPQCCYGLKLKINRRNDYEAAPHEVIPRCVSDLQKPLMARCCPHNPTCRPPNATFPYLMPCFWPCRPSAPCLDPTKCFHHPKCLPPLRPKGFVPISQECPKPGPCNNKAKKTTCGNLSCLGTNKEFQKGLTAWGKLEVPKKQEKSKEKSKEKASPTHSVHKMGHSEHSSGHSSHKSEKERTHSSGHSSPERRHSSHKSEKEHTPDRHHSATKLARSPEHHPDKAELKIDVTKKEGKEHKRSHHHQSPYRPTR